MISVHTITASVAPNKRECGAPGPNQPRRDDFAGGVAYNDAMPGGPRRFPFILMRGSGSLRTNPHS